MDFGPCEINKRKPVRRHKPSLAAEAGSAMARLQGSSMAASAADLPQSALTLGCGRFVLKLCRLGPMAASIPARAVTPPESYLLPADFFASPSTAVTATAPSRLPKNARIASAT